MTESAQLITLHLRRPSTWDLLAAGVDRITFSLTEPRIVPQDDIDADPRWTSDSVCEQFRMLRKLQFECLTQAVWGLVRNTAFAGIPYDTWEGKQAATTEPDGSIPPDEWAAQIQLRISDRAFDGGRMVPLTLTGPYTSHFNQFRGDDPLPSDAPPVLVWLLPPKMDRRFVGEEIDFGTGRQRSFLYSPAMADDPTLRLDALLRGVPEAIGRVLAAAARDGISAGTDGIPDLEWSRVVPLWFSLRE